MSVKSFEKGTMTFPAYCGKPSMPDRKGTEPGTCAEHRGLSTRSERPQNRKRDHPLPSFLETTRVDGVKAPQHRGTPRSDLLVRRFQSTGRLLERVDLALF